MAENTFLLEIITPERSFYSGQARQLVVTGLDGTFGILRGHVPMVASLDIGPVHIQEADGSWREAACSGGFLRTGPDHTLVMVQTAEWPEEIDLNRAREQAEIEEEHLRQQQSMREYVASKNNLTKALMRLRVGAKSTINHD